MESTGPHFRPLPGRISLVNLVQTHLALLCFALLLFTDVLLFEVTDDGVGWAGEGLVKESQHMQTESPETVHVASSRKRDRAYSGICIGVGEYMLNILGLQRKAQSLLTGLAKMQCKKWNQFNHWRRGKKKGTYSREREKHILIEKIHVCLGI